MIAGAGKTSCVDAPRPCSRQDIRQPREGTPSLAHLSAYEIRGRAGLSDGELVGRFVLIIF
jgi:hypothetical protein